MSIIKWDELQLKFDFSELDELGDDAEDRAITPAEARQISEAARSVLELEEPIPLGNSPDENENRVVYARKRKPEWMQDYLKLRQMGWPWRVACYIAWASSPKIGRLPETLGELATKVLGLASPRVIYTWRQKYPSIDTVVSMMQAAPLWEHRRDVLNTLAAMASKEDYKSHNDRKLFLEMIGDYTPKQLLGFRKAGKGSLSEMSEEELRRFVGEEPMEAEEERDPDKPTEEVGDVGSEVENVS